MKFSYQLVLIMDGMEEAGQTGQTYNKKRKTRYVKRKPKKEEFNLNGVHHQPKDLYYYNALKDCHLRSGLGLDFFLWIFFSKRV